MVVATGCGKNLKGETFYIYFDERYYDSNRWGKFLRVSPGVGSWPDVWFVCGYGGGAVTLCEDCLIGKGYIW